MNNQQNVSRKCSTGFLKFKSWTPPDRAKALQKLAFAATGFNLTGHYCYFSEKNVAICEAAKITPLIAVGREGHHQEWRERFTEPEPLTADATSVEKMKHMLKTKAGRALYALRKQTVEPVFGIIKSVMGFRQFLMRGLDNVQTEWTLVCLAWNLKRMAVLRPQ